MLASSLRRRCTLSACCRAMLLATRWPRSAALRWSPPAAGSEPPRSLRTTFRTSTSSTLLCAKWITMQSSSSGSTSSSRGYRSTKSAADVVPFGGRRHFEPQHPIDSALLLACETIQGFRYHLRHRLQEGISVLLKILHAPSVVLKGSKLLLRYPAGIV